MVELEFLTDPMTYHVRFFSLGFLRLGADMDAKMHVKQG
jgi:hypothetical protein